MPAQSAHVAQVASNLRAYADVPPGYPGWRAVVLFYAAVHLVEALAAADGRHHREHQARQAYIKQHHEGIYGAYMRLKNESLKARYMTGSGQAEPTRIATAFALSAEQVDRQLRHGAYSKVDTYVQERLKRAE